MKPETYDYTLTTAKGYALLALCAIGAVGMGYLALTHGGTLRFLGFELGYHGTTVAFGGLGLICAAIVVDQLRDLLKPQAVKAPIRLDAEAIVAPARWDNPSLLRLTYKGISDVKPRLVGQDRVLEVKHIEGNLYISAAAMESREAFDRLWRSLEARVGLHRGYRY